MTSYPQSVTAAGDELWAQVLGWARDFARAVRGRDYASAAQGFDRSVLGFGTRTVEARGLDTLIAEQWRHIWPYTQGFEFDESTAAGSVAGDGAWFAARWSSRTAGDAPPITRTGRATIVLRRDGGRWVALHTHFSLDPTDPRVGRRPGVCP